jgi:phosphoribosylformylglycinamidine synthase
MAFAGGVGAAIDLRDVPRGEAIERGDVLFFSESTGRFLVEVPSEHEAAFAARFRGLPASRIGTTTAEPALRVAGLDGSAVLDRSLDELKAAWQTPLGW